MHAHNSHLPYVEFSTFALLLSTRLWHTAEAKVVVNLGGDQSRRRVGGDAAYSFITTMVI